jgi:hypothetical protein
MTMFFWVYSPCKFVSRNQRFGEACCLHLQGLDSTLLRSVGFYQPIHTATKPQKYHQNFHRRQNLISHKLH